EDSKIFDIDEEPTPSGLFTRITHYDEDLEGVSFYTQMLNRWREILLAHPNLEQDLKDFPTRVKVAKAAQSQELLVFFRKNRLFIQKLAEGETEPELIAFEDALPLAECKPDQPRLPLSPKFWNNYAIAKTIKTETSGRGLSAQSVETKAFNNLLTLNRLALPDLGPLKNFLATLLDDVREWSTLPKFTLRTIANLKFNTPKQIEQTRDKLQNLLLQLGSDYLQKEIERQKEVREEIVIAVENQKQ
ncbi:MAG: hypothetical protein GX559_04025, partial [Candidatus Pacebacteria bacterium]|nr:hypothetical protein [Candidatus Paceibacterota bacterium]